MLVSGLRNRFPYNPPLPDNNRLPTSPRYGAAPARNVPAHHQIFDVLEREKRFTHAGLWLDKYLVFQEKKDEAPDPQRRSSTLQNATAQKEEESSRAQLVREVAELPISEIYEHFYPQWKQRLELYGAKTWEARAKGRVIVGLGTESVLETSLALHRTYGVPYIPGSALKGLAASYLRSQFGKDWRKDETKRQQYNVIFGDTNESGCIIFFDAFYIIDEKQNGPALYPDILTVHHPDYYKGQSDTSPKDTDNPNPVSFLSTTGRYLLALAAPDLPKQDRDPWLKATFELLDNALQHRGIGAKTSSGYGRMALIRDKETPDDEPLPDAQTVPAVPQIKIPPLSPEAQRCLNQIQQIPKPLFGRDIFQGYTAWKTLNAREDRLFIAITIIERIREEGYEQDKAKKVWYRELVAFVAEEAEGK